MTQLIILDRDGVINQDRDDFVKSADEWEPIAGSLEAIARLNHAGWQVVIASNQSAIGRGLYGVADLNAMHAKMHTLLAEVGGRIDAVFFCPHTPEDGCECRKPLPGLFTRISERLGVSLQGVPTVGDSLRDMQAGAAAGCTLHFVRTGKGARLLEQIQAQQSEALPAGAAVHDDLAAVVAHLLKDVA
jgi:D-glycero-D-manno-heptose 1,7-bisphosphate phosphatase